jgi:hypothetical protein
LLKDIAGAVKTEVVKKKRSIQYHVTHSRKQVKKTADQSLHEPGGGTDIEKVRLHGRLNI